MTDPARTPPPALTPEERQKVLEWAKWLANGNKSIIPHTATLMLARALLDAERRVQELTTLCAEAAVEIEVAIRERWGEPPIHPANQRKYDRDSASTIADNEDEQVWQRERRQWELVGQADKAFERLARQVIREVRRG